MALATRCPHCQTAFRVASDQLKLRAGLVRCGTCKEIFNGIENLLHPDEDVSSLATPAAEAAVDPGADAAGDSVRLWQALDAFSMAPPAAEAATAQPVDESTADHAKRILVIDYADAAATDPGYSLDADSDDDGDVDYGSESEPEIETASASDSTDDVDSDATSVDDADSNSDRDPDFHADVDAAVDGDPESVTGTGSNHLTDHKPAPGLAASVDAPALPHLLRTASIADDDAVASPAASVVPPIAASKPRKPAKPTPAALTEEELVDRLPDFVTREEEREDRHRARRPLMIMAAVLLSLALFAQALYAGRTSLAAAVPALRPLLDQACRLVGCTVGLPMQIESVSIESSDLQPYPDHPDQFLLSVLLRNRSSTVQAWPTIELTLNDATDKAVGRRLIMPYDYLPAGQTNLRGFSAGSEQAMRLVFDLSRLKASGYRVYLFYP